MSEIEAVTGYPDLQPKVSTQAVAMTNGEVLEVPNVADVQLDNGALFLLDKGGEILIAVASGQWAYLMGDSHEQD